MKVPPIKAALWITVALAAVIVTALVAFNLSGSASYLIYLATDGDTLDIWAALSLLTVISAAVGVFGAWFFLLRKRPGLAAAALLLPFPAPFLLEANRCDVYPICESTDWARLPRQAFAWRIRIRDVDEHSAYNIAMAALLDAKLDYHAWDPKLVAGEWRVETRADDMDLGPYEVIVDPKTGSTRIVVRPAPPK